MISWKKFLSLFKRKKVLDELRKKRAVAIPAAVAVIEGVTKWI